MVCDTGPIVAAINRRDRAHSLASELLSDLGRDLLVPLPVVSEADHLIRARSGSGAARAFLRAISFQEVSIGYLNVRLFTRAVEIDAKYEGLDLGIVDTSVMAIAEEGNYPILTFDYADFRAAPPESGHWWLLVDESQYLDAIGD